jgi:hypothetical protein
LPDEATNLKRASLYHKNKRKQGYFDNPKKMMGLFPEPMF